MLLVILISRHQESVYCNMMSKMRLYFRLLIMRVSAGSHNAPLEYSYVLHPPRLHSLMSLKAARVAFHL